MIFDTNIVSEPMQAFPNAKVMRWLDQLDMNSCYITAITVAELFAGIERLSEGKKRDQLTATANFIVNKKFENRILFFDVFAARQYSVAIEKLRKQGLNGMDVDIMIAGIALAHHLPVATRDVKPFQAAGVTVINPWADE
jgi:toxin FitB